MPFTTKGPDLTIPQGANVSNHVYADGNYEGARGGIMLYAPAVLLEAGTIEVTDGRLGTDATNVWRTLQIDSETAAAADIAIPAAGKARLIKELASANGFRIKLGGNAALIRVFNTSLIGL